MRRAMRGWIVVVAAVVAAGCAERPEEVSATRFRAETERALRREAAADVVAEYSYKDWRVSKPAPSPPPVLTEEKFYDWLAKYSGAKRAAVVVMGRRDPPVRTQRDLDEIQAAIDVIEKAFKEAGFERVAFHQVAGFGRAILRE
jgi:hypothetical protein